jgi:hypothetical protein
MRGRLTAGAAPQNGREEPAMKTTTTATALALLLGLGLALPAAVQQQPPAFR